MIKNNMSEEYRSSRRRRGGGVEETTTGTTREKTKKKSAGREWGETLLFALIVVPLVNIFILQSYAIPTSSMEGSMLVGDKLFVSKFHYGARIPQTPLALPFVHDRIPGTNTQAYAELIKLPYMRLPGFRDIKNEDIVVFNWPEGDTMTLEKLSTESYYEMCRNGGHKAVNKRYNIVTRPVDKRENYVKRCLAIAGDEIEIKDGLVYINGTLQENNSLVQYNHIVQTKRGVISSKNLEKFGLLPREKPYEYGQIDQNTYYMMLSDETAELLRQEDYIKSVTKNIVEAGKPDSNNRIFPHKSDRFPWNRDNFGPLWIPKEGETIDLTEDNFYLYGRCIKNFEDNPSLKWKDGQAHIDGKPIDKYTFKMNYYWLMGDNRHNSQDSRFWGFVPEDHIVGTPIFVWLSTESQYSWAQFWKKIRWGKSFRIPR